MVEAEEGETTAEVVVAVMKIIGEDGVPVQPVAEEERKAGPMPAGQHNLKRVMHRRVPR